MENVDKIKMVILCHFSNQEVRQYMKFYQGFMFSLGRKLLRLPAKSSVMGDISPWVTYLVDFLRKRDDIDLYVVSSQSKTRKATYRFASHGVKYAFVRCDMANMLKYVCKTPQKWHKHNPLRIRVKGIVDEIKPDIVVLIGAENAFIADCAIDLLGYPHLIQCQTIYNNPNRAEFDSIDEKNAFVERELFRKAKYVAIPTRMHYALFKQLESNAMVFDWKAKTPFARVECVEEKDYDFVTFAVNMCEKKGYFDAVKAMSLVVKQYPQATLNLVGGGELTIKQKLKQLCVECGIEKNVFFTDFFEKQEDLFRHIMKSKFALLPSKLDHISGTMSQAMYYGLPLVCYKTEGTPLLNQEKECVLIAEMNDINGLAEKMLILLSNSAKADELKKNAKERMIKKDNMPAATDRLVNTYKAIVAYEKYGIAIPEYLNFNPQAV